MAKVTVKLNSKGVVDLLHNAGDICLDMAKEAAGRCGEGYEAVKRVYPERTAAVVRTATYEAVRDNLENNTILKAVMGR